MPVWLSLRAYGVEKAQCNVGCRVLIGAVGVWGLDRFRGGRMSGGMLPDWTPARLVHYSHFGLYLAVQVERCWLM